MAAQKKCSNRTGLPETRPAEQFQMCSNCLEEMMQLTSYTPLFITRPAQAFLEIRRYTRINAKNGVKGSKAAWVSVPKKQSLML